MSNTFSPNFSAPNFSALTRREMLHRAGMGFGALGLAATLQSAGRLVAGEASTVAASKGQLSPSERAPHFAAKAKRVIVLFMNGGPSHVDTFDPKPALKTHEGQKPDGKLFKAAQAGFVPSPFAFAAHGKSGVVMSELFPRLAKCADDVCVVRSMYTDVPNHEPGLLLMHSGNMQPTRPSLGSWASYGLGTQNQNLPAFVVLAPRRPVVGPQLWSSSFLPGSHQGMAVKTADKAADMTVEKLVADLRSGSLSRAEQREQLDLLAELNRLHSVERRQQNSAESAASDSALETEIRAMETAFAMQTEAAEAFDISREPAEVRAAYGDTLFGRQCLLARRLSERGVRFVESYYLTPGGNQPWDTHSNNDDAHRKLCADSDRATAALLTDLKRLGLLDETLVVWAGEFGRTPYAQPNNKGKHGRDHHHTAFSILLAGGGVKGGLMYGASDELGMNAVENRVHVHDLHATILHLLGLDHEKLTYRYAGRDFRLTDVHGTVVRDILA